MKPAYDQLSQEYADSSSVVVADVDCTADGKDLCEKYSVRGYPTIKYFVDGDADGKDYQSGRDYDSLKAFVESTLEIKCDVKDPTECSDKEKAYIEKMKDKPSEERVKKIARLDSMKGESMKADLKMWVTQRLRILKSLEGGEEKEL